MKKKFSFFKDNNYHYLKILGVILASILFFVIISNLGVVTAALSKLFNVFMPIFLGLVFAFIFNLPMKFFENKLFKKLTIKDGKVWKKKKTDLPFYERAFCSLRAYSFTVCCYSGVCKNLRKVLY